MNTLDGFTDDQLRDELRRRDPQFVLKSMALKYQQPITNYAFFAPMELGAAFALTFQPTSTESIHENFSAEDMTKLADWITARIRALKPTPNIHHRD